MPNKTKLVITSVIILVIGQSLSIIIKFLSVFLIEGACNEDFVTDQRTLKQIFIIVVDGLTCYMIIYLFYSISEETARRRRRKKETGNKDLGGNQG